MFQKQSPKRFFKISVLIFQEQPFYNLPGGSIIFFERACFFPGDFIEQTFYFQGLSVREQSLLSQRTDTNFPRNPYLVLKHIRIFQEPLFSHRTDIHFPGDAANR